MSTEYTPEPDDSPAGTYAKYSGLAFQMLASIAGGVLLGQYLDRRMALATPWWTIGLTLLGLGAAMYYVFRSLPKYSDDKPKK